MKTVAGNQKAMALVVTLAVIVLITGLALAFLSHSRMNRQISFAGVSNVKSDILARSALTVIVGEIREDIRLGSLSEDGGNAAYPSVYKPALPANLLPSRSGIDDPAAATSANLIAVSAYNNSLHSHSTNARKIGSSISISTPSSNGRTLSATRWFGAEYGPNLGSQTTLPKWTYVSRKEVVAGDPVIENARQRSSDDFVIGRFAFTVYDLSGLFNANVAGYPSVASGQAAFKSSQAYADLTVLPGFDTQSVDALAKWRNHEDAASGSAYENYLTNWGSRYGFSQIKDGNNALFSRRDLINGAQSEKVGIPASALPHLTAFSRALTAPDFIPAALDGSSVDYPGDANKSASANRNIPNVRFTASGTVAHYRDDGTVANEPVSAGQSLLRNRFSLAKLAWLGPRGPNASAFDGSLGAEEQSQAIQSCFGLRWDDTDERWLYVGHDGSSVRSQIKTLAQVASDLREPDFFETLKAGVLSGSLGTKGPDITTITGGKRLSGVLQQLCFDNQPDLQLIRIGANIIDCADSDNFPTRIAFQISMGGIAREVTPAGIEDLPYVQNLLFTMLRIGKPEVRDGVTGTLLEKMDHVCAPMLFNPHRSGSPASESPSAIRLSIASGMLDSITYPAPIPTIQKDLTTLPALELAAGELETFRAKPLLIRSGSDSSTLANLISYATSDDANVHCWHLYSYSEDTAAGILPYYHYPTTGSRLVFQNLAISTQYKSPKGIWRTYASFWTSEELADLLGGMAANSGPDLVSARTITDLVGSQFINQRDPRTNRFGAAAGWSIRPKTTPPTLSPDPALPGADTGMVRFGIPFPDGNVMKSTYYTLWPEGRKGEGSGDYGWTNVSDSDKVFRPADSWLGPDANLYRNLSDPARRPVILQRPFRSVGELGCVFRDQAWKTLDIFDETSGDSGLTALFCVADKPRVTADLVHLDTRQTATTEAFLKGAAWDLVSGETLAPETAKAVAEAFTDYAFEAGVPTANLPLNPSQTANFLMSLNGNPALDLGPIKYRREVVPRALASSAQTRTWNLLIDVVAQTGNFPLNAQDASQFVVEGEKRYWLSIAIDRYTGKIVAQQLEPVHE
jgi:hypothetical protein